MEEKSKEQLIAEIKQMRIEVILRLIAVFIGISGIIFCFINLKVAMGIFAIECLFEAFAEG